VERWFSRSQQLSLRDRGEPLTVGHRYAARLKEKFG
jgi:DNA-binding LytR/AlgR family response regulator